MFERSVEWCRIHNFRQRYAIGQLRNQRTKEHLSAFLLSEGYEKAILAWKDPGEVLSMRKIDLHQFQFHIRLFSDGEVRAHYEYAPEVHPWKHFVEVGFEPRREHFIAFLKDFLSISES